MKSDDQKIQRYFEMLRSVDSAAAPSFHSLLCAISPDRRRKINWGLPRIWVSLGATAAAAAILVLLFHGPQASAPGLTADDHLQAICRWIPSTDTLLTSNTGMWDSSSATDELIDNENTYHKNQSNSRL